MHWRPPRFLLAPLTKGGNLPFRRLCVEFGAEVTMSEMAYARQVVRGSRSELALLRKHPSETCFGVQLAAGNPRDAVAAAQTAVERGTAFVDLNVGCPIHDVVRRGMGATLLQRPEALQRIVAALADALTVPVTVKLRSGWKADEINAPEIARLCEEAGAAMITLHARTREQRYTSHADWELVRQLAAERRVPIVGNGDVLTWHEAEDRLAHSGCAAVMLGRGALIKPWIFEEMRARSTWLPSTAERIEVWHRLARFLKEHFRDDAKGRERAMRFLPWHIDFLSRWRPMPEERFVTAAREAPLLQTRFPDLEDLPPLERLLRDPRASVHERIAAELWEAADTAEAVRRLEAVAQETDPPGDLEPDEVPVSHG